MNETKYPDVSLTILTTARGVWVLHAMGLSEKLDEMCLRSIHPEGMEEAALTRAPLLCGSIIAPHTVPTWVPYRLPRASHTIAGKRF